MTSRTLPFAALALLLASGAQAATPPWPRNATADQIRAAREKFERQMTSTMPPARPQEAAEAVYQEVFAAVDSGHLESLLKDMSGVRPVTAGGKTFSISDRYTPASKADYREYWKQYFRGLGLAINEIPYRSSQGNGEEQGHDLEAVLAGASADSVVIIVHYDSIGPNGPDNPGADDDMSGMSVLMETARVLAARKDRLQRTVRFVASDYEEWGGLEGARAYASYISGLAKQGNFKVVAAIDDEQSGWNEGSGDLFDFFDCGGATDSKALGGLLSDTAAVYSRMQTSHGCMGENSDHYAMWEVGVPAVVLSEHDPFNNPHFDQEGGDTYDRIDSGYHLRIAQVGVTFAARVAGLEPPAPKVANRLPRMPRVQVAW
ncbi:MAG: M28 family peptidase [Elusimicrobia bacterium]|nr:M28 family peptidase [Elusimicrobiota bacterium]